MAEKIIFATGNAGKMKEIQMIMSDLDVEVVSMKDAGINIDIDENGTTFEENALIKARAVMQECNMITLADDSGLEVDYLNKEPGVYSARYMGEDTSYDIKNRSIIDRLEGVTTRGTIEGLIGYEQKGENGFGYDPIVYVPEYDATTAELSMEVKNSISHRGKALAAMKAKLLEMGLVKKK